MFDLQVAESTPDAKSNELRNHLPESESFSKITLQYNKKIKRQELNVKRVRKSSKMLKKRKNRLI